MSLDGLCNGGKPDQKFQFDKPTTPIRKQLANQCELVDTINS